MSGIHPEPAEKDNVAEAIDHVLHEVEAARLDLSMTRFHLQQAETLRRIDLAKAGLANLVQRCSLTQRRESLYRSRIVKPWGFDMDDVKAVIQQATDAIGTPPEASAEAPKPEMGTLPEAPAEAPKPDMKKVRRATKKVARKVGPKKKAGKTAKKPAKKSAEKAPKTKAKKKKKKAKR